MNEVQDKLLIRSRQVACAQVCHSRGRFGMLQFRGRRGVTSWWESRTDFPEVSLQLLNPSAWELMAYGGFFREENIIIHEPSSILYAVRFAESKYPPGRLLVLSDNLALVLALCKGRSLKNTAFSLASNLRVQFPTRCV